MLIVGLCIIFVGLKIRSNPGSWSESDEAQISEYRYAVDSPRTDFRRYEGRRLEFRVNNATDFGVFNVNSEQSERQCSQESDRIEIVTDAKNDRDLWTPDHEYGSDHKAAVEAALSTVLTVSTLAGFRPDGLVTPRKRCCLHHAIQVGEINMRPLSNDSPALEACY